MSDLLTLEQLFSSDGEDRFFHIPDYQRGYSWEAEQRADLLDDLADLAAHDVTHFMGTIVAARPEDGEGAYQVVDGQQRLTSLVLLLGRLLLRLESLGCSQAMPGMTLAQAREAFIVSTAHIGATDPRLELNSDTTALFRQVCLQPDIPSEHVPPRNKAETNLLQAAHQFDRYLGRQSEASLGALFQVATQRIGFLFYTPRNSTEIGLMFEVINSRGKPLSELDKVKNFLIYYASRHAMPDLHEQVNDAWAGILSDLNHAGMTTNDEEQMFLQSCWIPFGEPRSRKSGPVYEGVKARVADESLADGYKRLAAFVRLLRHGAQTFRQIYSRLAAQDGSDESRCLERLSFHPRLASVLPIIVALYYREPDAAARAATLELIEKLNFRYYVLGIATRSDSRQSELFQLAYDYFHGDGDVAGDAFSTADLRQSLVRFIGSNAEIRRVVKNLVLESDESWDFYDWPGLKFFLASYEQALCEAKHQSRPLPELLTGRDPEAYNDFYQREHIVAQNEHEAIGAEVADFVQRRLGNFVLMREGTNKSASDGRAVDKIGETYEASGMNRLYQVNELKPLLADAESYVSNERGWQRDAKGYREERLKRLMDKREEALVAFALRRWHVPEADVADMPLIEVDSVFTDGAVWKRVPAGSEQSRT